MRSKGQLLSDYRGRVLELNVAAGQIVSAGERLGALEAENTDAELVAAAYFAVGAGKQLAIGDAVSVSPATVERARHGSLVGRIASISPFPVTTDAITNVVGSREIARELARDGSRIQVIAELDPDPQAPSGYRWTSGRGPEVEVSAGTTASNGGAAPADRLRHPDPEALEWHLSASPAPAWCGAGSVLRPSFSSKRLNAAQPPWPWCWPTTAGSFR